MLRDPLPKDDHQPPCCQHLHVTRNGPEIMSKTAPTVRQKALGSRTSLPHTPTYLMRMIASLVSSGPMVGAGRSSNLASPALCKTQEIFLNVSDFFWNSANALTYLLSHFCLLLAVPRAALKVEFPIVGYNVQYELKSLACLIYTAVALWMSIIPSSSEYRGVRGVVSDSSIHGGQFSPGQVPPKSI
jgi:hypothetical protein